MFNDSKLIIKMRWLINLFQKIDDLLEKTRSYLLIPFANLEKIKIRSFEKDKKRGIVACYQDNHRTLSDYVREN